jgi:hypothetical protein
MLVHRMVKKVKNSKMLARINMKDSDVDWKGMLVKDDGPDYYTAITTLARIANNPRAGKYELMNQLLPIMQANKVDFDKGKFEQAWREFNKAGMSKGIFDKSKDADYRGYKVTDQIIKGFLIYKTDKKPATFVAKNENGKQYEGTIEQVKKQIDDYWVKQDEDVMKQKVRDAGISREKYMQMKRDAESDLVEATKKNDMEGIKEAKALLSDIEADWKESVELNKDSKSKDKSPKVEELEKAITLNRKAGNTNLADKLQKELDEELKKEMIWQNKDSKPKHPRWRIKDDKLFRLRSAVKDIRRRVKDAYTKGSADKKTKDDDKSDELKMMIQQMGKVEGIRAFAKKYPEYIPQFASYFKKKVEERGGSKDGGPGSGQKGHKTAQFADPTTHKERRKTLADLKLYFNKAVKAGNRKEAVKISNRMAHLTSLHLKDAKTKDEAVSVQDYKGYKITVKQFGKDVFEFTIMMQKNGKDVYKGIQETSLGARATARRWIDQNQKSTDKLTGDPLTKKGNKILAKMRERYGKKKGESVFYASKNKGTIAGVDGKAKDGEYNVLKGKLDKIKREIERYEKAGQENSPEYKDLKKQEAKLGYDLMAYINRPKDSKSKDAGNPTTLLAKRSGWIGDFGYLPNMLIYLSLRPDGQVSVGANAPSKYGTNIPLSRIKQAIAKGDIEIGHRGEVDI